MLASVLSLLAINPWAAVASSACFGDLEVVPTTIDGTPVSGAAVQLIKAGTHQSINTRSTLIRDVPCGEYTLIIKRAGFFAKQQEIEVYQPGVLRRVGLVVANFGPPATVHGFVSQTYGSTSQLWVKIVPTLSQNILIECKVASNNTFEVAALRPGPYTAMLFRGTSLVATRSFEASSGTRIKF